MKLNENESILTPRLLLVPYCAHHVQTYHEWMQDEELQKLTASEPLTLSEEYSMQESWRQDADKLTFIICTAPDATTETYLERISPGKEDKPECMIGDVNLFLYDDDDEEEENDTNGEPEILRVVGELEIMIARPDARGKGLAQEALEAFISYISTSLPAILNEYTQGKNKTACLSYLRVKIDKDNSRSLSLFKKLGFSDIRGPNYFGEMELRSKRVAGHNADQEGEGKGIAEKLPYGSSL